MIWLLTIILLLSIFGVGEVAHKKNGEPLTFKERLAATREKLRSILSRKKKEESSEKEESSDTDPEK